MVDAWTDGKNKKKEDKFLELSNYLIHEVKHPIVYTYTFRQHSGPDSVVTDYTNSKSQDSDLPNSPIFAAVDSQYRSLPGYRPDMTFNDYNDRFSLNPLQFYRNKKHHSTAFDNRRTSYTDIMSNDPNSKTIIKKIKDKVEKELNNVAKDISHSMRRSVNDVDYVIEDKEGNEFLVHDGEEPVRRSLDNIFVNLYGSRRGGGNEIEAEKEAIFNYAFPVQMTLRGYMTVPTDF